MPIHIFWDCPLTKCHSLPVSRIISSLLKIPLTIGENPILLQGHSREREQTDAQVLLHNLQIYKYRQGIRDPILLVVHQDLYTPDHSFVFGLARESVGVAVVSSARLNNEFYGRRGRDDDLVDRLSKEATHEIGHLLSLSHCTDPECIMFNPETLDQLDRKRKVFCSSCVERLDMKR